MFQISLVKRSKLMPGFTGCKAAMHGQTCLRLSAGALLLARSLNAIDSVLFVAPTLIQAKYKAVKTYPSGPVGLKMGCCSFFSEEPVSVGVNVTFKV